MPHQERECHREQRRESRPRQPLHDGLTDAAGHCVSEVTEHDAEESAGGEPPLVRRQRGQTECRIVGLEQRTGEGRRENDHHRTVGDEGPWPLSGRFAPHGPHHGEHERDRGRRLDERSQGQHTRSGEVPNCCSSEPAGLLIHSYVFHGMRRFRREGAKGGGQAEHDVGPHARKLLTWALLH